MARANGSLPGDHEWAYAPFKRSRPASATKAMTPTDQRLRPISVLDTF